MCLARRTKYLKSQIMMPTYEKLQQCNFCHKLFSSLELQKHLLTHTGENPYQCICCGKSFTMSDHLKEYMRTHTGQKSHQCNVCEKYFSTNGSLKTSCTVYDPICHVNIL